MGSTPAPAGVGLPWGRLSVTTHPVRIGSGQVLSAALALAIAGVAASVLLGEHGVAHLLRLRAERRGRGPTAVRLIEGNARPRGGNQRLRGGHPPPPGPG